MMAFHESQSLTFQAFQSFNSHAEDLPSPHNHECPTVEALSQLEF
jgi:hypothetical protein